MGYGGANGTSFDVMNVPSRVGWAYVEDAGNGANGIWPTITQFSVPQLSNIAIPVVTQQLFTNLASDLPSVQLTGCRRRQRRSCWSSPSPASPTRACK